MSKQISVTIVIPNYNGEKYIVQCLESVNKSSVIVDKIIVVDNGSKDHSVSVIKERFPKVEIIKHEINSGFTGAVNDGISYNNSRYVFLLNNDTIIDENCIERLYNALEENKNIFCAGALMLSMDHPDLVDDAGDRYSVLGYARAIGNGKNASKYLEEKCVPVFTASAGAAMYRSSVFERIGYFDDDHFAYLEDVDIGYRARIYGYINVSVRDAIVYHKGSATSGSKHNKFKVSYSSQNSILVPLKNMPLIQYLLNMPFLIVGYVIKFLFFSCKGFGLVYLRGLMKGLQLFFSKEGYRKHVKFTFSRFINYIKVQFWLIRGLLP